MEIADFVIAAVNIVLFAFQQLLVSVSGMSAGDLSDGGIAFLVFFALCIFAPRFHPRWK